MDPASSTTRATVRGPGASAIAGAAVAVAAVAAIRLLWASRGWPLVHDAPLMHYVAQRLAAGDRPYRDLFDMNFPGVYLAHRLVLATLGPGDAAFRIYDLAILALVAAGLAAALSPLGCWAGPAAAALFALYHVAGGPWLAGQRDFLLCAPLAWGAAGALAASHAVGRARVRALGLAGLALGAAVTVKPHAALLAPGLGLLAWRGPAPGRALAAAAAGVVLPLALAAAWLASQGALGAFLGIVLGYLVPLYARLGRTSLLRALLGGDYGIDVLLGLLAWVALGALALRAARRGAALAVLAAGLGYGLLHFGLQGRGWEYHFYPAALFAAALGGAGLGAAAAGGRRVLALMLALALAGTTAALWAKGHRNLDPAWVRQKLARVERVVRALRPVVAGGGQVQVFDTTAGGVHALLVTGARQPTRFLYDFHFYHDVTHPHVRRLRAELLAGLRARPPAAVVLFEEGWPAGGYERVERFPELGRWLAEGYRLADSGDGYRLFLAASAGGGGGGGGGG